MYRILIAVRDEQDFRSLPRLGMMLARAHEGEVRIITVNRQGTRPEWLQDNEVFADAVVDLVVRKSKNASAAILEEIKGYGADVLLLNWKGPLKRGQTLLGSTLDPVVQGAPCDVIVMHKDLDHPIRRVLLPAAGGPNAPEAIEMARRIAPDAEITALYVANQAQGPMEALVGQARLDALVQRLAEHDRTSVRTEVIQASSPIEGILAQAEQGYDVLILGAGNEDVIGRFLFGDIPHAILTQSPIPVIIVRRHLTYLSSFWRRLWVRIFGLVPTLTLSDQAEVFRTMRQGSRPTADFFVMLSLAAALAALGLLMNSPAVIIGAMVVAPLMTTILAMGFSVVVADSRFFWRAANMTIRGTVLVIGTGMLIGLLVPGSEASDLMRRMAYPSILDLAVALTGGAAAAYAICRKDVSAALAGVAIATSLAPPLAGVGLGITLGAWRIVLGASLIYLANTVSIVAVSGFVFLWFGFRPRPGDPERASIQRRGFLSVEILLALVAIPLIAFTARSLYETRLQRQVGTAIEAELSSFSETEVVDWQHSLGDSGVVQLRISLETTRTLTYEEARLLQERIAERIGRPVQLSLNMIPTQRLRAYVPPTATLEANPTPAP